MALHLEALDAAVATKPIAVQAGRPRVFKIVKRGHAAGTVTVELHGGQCIATNRSERPLLVNGKEQARCVLSDGDTVVIGKDSFRVVDTAAGGGQEPDPNQITSYLPTPDLSPKSHQALATREETPPGARAPAAKVVSVPAHPPAPSSTSQPMPHDGDSRRRRSISASMHSVVDQPKPGILNRVSSVFSSKTRADRGREDELQRERHLLLEEVGRQVLSGQALGIPDAVFADLLAGRPVTIQPDDVPRVALERWRELTQRVALLDAEIAALRRNLGLGADLGAVSLTSPSARNVLKQREDKVFESLDSLATQDLAGQADHLEPIALDEPRSSSGTSRAPSVGGHNRVSARRRHV